MNPDETQLGLMGEALLQIAQRIVKQVSAGGGAQRDVLEFGFEVKHIGHRHANQAATVVDDDHRSRVADGGCACDVRRCWHQAQALSDPRQGGLKALAANRFGEVIHRIEVKGFERMFGVGGHKHHRWRA